MALTESDAQSFIIKLLLEQTEGEQAHLSHGYVTHVASGERCYVKELGGVTEFIVECLVQMGVRPGVRWRAKLWLKQWRARRRKRT